MKPAFVIGVLVTEPRGPYRVGAEDRDDAFAQAFAREDLLGPRFASKAPVREPIEETPRSVRRRRRPRAPTATPWTHDARAHARG